jgi:hypothetical protein
MKATEDFWHAIFDLAGKYGIAVTNNEPRPGLPHIADFGEDVLALLALAQPVVYVLESQGDGEESTHLEGVFTSVAKAQAHMDAFLGRELDWQPNEWGLYAHLVARIVDDCRFVDAYYIRAHTIDQEPGDDDE